MAVWNLATEDAFLLRLISYKILTKYPMLNTSERVLTFILRCPHSDSGVHETA